MNLYQQLEFEFMWEFRLEEYCKKLEDPNSPESKEYEERVKRLKDPESEERRLYDKAVAESLERSRPFMEKIIQSGILSGEDYKLRVRSA